MSELKKEGPDWRVSDALHVNLQEALRLLVAQRTRLLKELKVPTPATNA